ncbi:DUF1365 domain-containing protein [Rhizobium halophytocola]|uniref:DUF1365 family protein n=1 Tax=Rhizobium halophytocola TaxID=735519 RepID=A0ABS4DTQ5_9HYPH|nr:DUF1365 family protein [Rhizobium halophytocola]MBP1849076.1 DUF1365 family protein [Rhizobium halophytocola]
MSFQSALFPGEVVHARKRPRTHSLRYQVASFLLDLDELPELDAKLRLFGVNRFSAFSFHEADHGDLQRGDLKAWALRHLTSAGIQTDGIRIRLLCYPRILGYAFNPLSVYFCERPDGEMAAVLYEVCNTFKERHTYVIPVTAGKARTIRHRCSKAMYVSPFVPMDCEYRFRIVTPEDDVLIAIDEHDADGSLLYASFAGKRVELTDAALAKTLLQYPLMTVKVVVAIHYEALKLWWKGLAIYRHKKAKVPVASSLVSRDATPGE